MRVSRGLATPPSIAVSVVYSHGFTDSDDKWYGPTKHWINLPTVIDKALQLPVAAKFFRYAERAPSLVIKAVCIPVPLPQATGICLTELSPMSERTLSHHSSSGQSRPLVDHGWLWPCASV